MALSAINVQAEVERLKTLPYTRELLPNEDGTWFARIVEFAGCMTEGDTPAEAFAMLDDAMTEWLTAKLEDGDLIPEPMAPERFPASSSFVRHVRCTAISRGARSAKVSRSTSTLSAFWRRQRVRRHKFAVSGAAYESPGC